MKLKLTSDSFPAAKFKRVIKPDGTTIYSIDPTAKNGTFIAEIYNDEGVPYKKVMKGETKDDVADFSENFGIVFHGVDNLVVDDIYIVPSS